MQTARMIPTVDTATELDDVTASRPTLSCAKGAAEWKEQKICSELNSGSGSDRTKADFGPLEFWQTWGPCHFWLIATVLLSGIWIHAVTPGPGFERASPQHRVSCLRCLQTSVKSWVWVAGRSVQESKLVWELEANSWNDLRLVLWVLSQLPPSELIWNLFNMTLGKDTPPPTFEVAFWY